MNLINRHVLVVLFFCPPMVYAGGIFNISPAENVESGRTAQPQSGVIAIQQRNLQRGQQVQDPPVQVQPQPRQPLYQPYRPPAASVIPGPLPDDNKIGQYDRFVNESDEAYIVRMKGVYRQSAVEMERVGAAHLQQMQALAPQ